ncbi:MAG: hypothetical protein HOE02_05565 [Candidatus Marinimicrobia bacterium]|jgi:hypothetical protein|nr:hypothetical protein [Candidatus Neomarinimicrobiota bacterium]
MKNPIEICAEIIRETDAAFLISDDGEKQVWIPKSIVETDQDGGPGDTIIFTMSERLAIEKGFV